MKILITGNMGYVGPVLIRHLRENISDLFLIGIDTGFFAHCLTNAGKLPETMIDIQFFSDIRSFPEKIFDQDIDAVVHLAAISNDPMGNAYEEATIAINHAAGIELAKKAKKHGVKTFIFASSCSMYGSADEAPRTEDSPLNPLTAYAKSKVLTERDLKSLADNEFSATSLRFSTACGMSDRLRLDLVLNDFVASAVSTGEITILSDGTPWRPLIHVKDMARAIEWALKRDKSSGGNFLAINVGSEQWNYQVKDLAYAVAETMPGIKVSINPDAQPDKRSYKVNFSLFKQLAPAFQPQIDLMTAVNELHNGLTQMRFNDLDFRNSQFMRLKVLGKLRENGLLSKNLQWC